ncbi:NAD-dependent epimerase/dehydratase family protein [Ectothiorhodospiraceae bacterium BW-2]|nr:NAD-dependent epimerase/dehydratase family protein [Ectothiorhodospiraceae bacterium BW-2]
MRILLTGATGFIGRYIVQELQQQAIDFVTLGRSNPDRYRNHITADLLATSDFADIVKTAQATHLIHLAWYAEHGKYWSSPLNLDWMQATTRLVEAF